MAHIDDLLGVDKLLGLRGFTREELTVYLAPILSLEPKPKPLPKVKEVFGTKVKNDEIVEEELIEGRCPIKPSKKKSTKIVKDQFDIFDDNAINNL